MAANNTKRVPLGFLSIPPELRIKVYNNLMKPEQDPDVDIEPSGDQSNIIHIRQDAPMIDGKSRSGQLLATNSVIRNEALPILYRTHGFRAYNTEQLNFGIRKIGSSHIQRIILRDPTHDFDHIRCAYQPFLLDLPNLTEVTLWCEHNWRLSDKKMPVDVILDLFRHSRPTPTHALRVFMEQITSSLDVTWRLHMRWKPWRVHGAEGKRLLVEFGIEDDETHPRHEPQWKWKVIKQEQ